MALRDWAAPAAATGDSTSSTDRLESAARLRLNASCTASVPRLGAGRVVVWLYDASAGTVNPVAGSGDEALRGWAGAWQEIPLSDLPPFERAIDGARPSVVRGPAFGGGRTAELAAALGARSMRCIRLGESAPVGVLVVEPATVRLPNQRSLVELAAGASELLAWRTVRRQRERYEFLVGRVGAANLAESSAELRNAVAVRRLFRQGAAARSLHETGEVLARVAVDALGAEVAGVYLADDAGLINDVITIGVSAGRHQRLSRRLRGLAATSTSVWKRALSSREPVVVDDTSRFAVRTGGVVQTLGLRSFVTIPLLSEEGTLGVVVCGNRSRRETPWDAEQRELAAQLTLEGSLLVEWARLRERERAHLTNLSHQATHDALTGLRNRAAFHAGLHETIAAGRRDGRRAALLLIDLNDFKQINDTFGHPQGDRLLQGVAQRLRVPLRAADVLARLGGDEFAVLATTSVSSRTVHRLAARLHAALEPPVLVGGLPLKLRASIGIALFPDHGADADSLLQHADMALYRAKREGVPSVSYSDGGYEHEARRLLLLGRLRDALAADEFVLHYQPIYDLATGRPAAVEALLRWVHPEYGLLTPGEFIPFAENTALIYPLTAWVIDAAIRQCGTWAERGHAVRVSVNVSARDLRDGRLSRTVRDALARYHVDADQLIVEITETSALLPLTAVAGTLRDLRRLGVRISIDDFGAGNTSLAHLAELPVDEIKLDASLAAQLETSRRSREVFTSLINLSHRLGHVVTVEGVENAKIAELARVSGCDRAQGFYFGRAQPAADVPAELARSRA